MTKRSRYFISAISSVICVASALAQEENVLPLPIGTYSTKIENCELGKLNSGDLASFIDIDPHGITYHNAFCEISNLSISKEIISFSETCSAGKGAHPYERQTKFTLLSPSSFAIGEITYVYCGGGLPMTQPTPG